MGKLVRARGKRSKIGRNVDKCKKYLVARRRIKNKTRELLKRLKTLTKKESIEKIKKVCVIGRKKERRD